MLTLHIILLAEVPNFKEIIEGIKEVLRLVYGDQSPSWILKLVGYALLSGLVLLALLGLLSLIGRIKDIWSEKFWPLFYNKDRRRAASRRRKFADHIESEIRRLNSLEEWKDYRFAELEAEVEAEGKHILFSWIPLIKFSRNTLRRERSLTKALRSSRERLILVEGDPGSGKSVALRHTAQVMAGHAMRSITLKSVIPIYLNLKEIECKNGVKVDKKLIRDFILKTLNRVNDRDIELFLEEEFDKGLREGTWLFLFDSFDEIPAILSSTDADEIIQEYAGAISDFLHGLNSCRGLIASRYFRGPRQFGWPRFRILPLSYSRQKELIRKADLRTAKEADLLGRLSSAGQDMQVMASNPMFLSLLCAHLRAGFAFPDNTHNVFENYISSRLVRDENRLKEHFALDLAEVRKTAELVAFCMAADQQIGLSPTRTDILSAAARLNISVEEKFDKILDALEYIKLARGEKNVVAKKSLSFTFSHRRIQEYFATCVVLREPDRVMPRQLLVDARWRETCVVLCQTQEADILLPIISEADLFISECIHFLEMTYGRRFIKKLRSGHMRPVKVTDPLIISDFAWPAKYLHVMGLLQDGLSRRLDLLPETLRLQASVIHSVSSQNGSLLDKKWAIDVSGIIPQSNLITLLREGFNGPSKWLRETSFRQAARLSRLPEDISKNIRLTLVAIALAGRLGEERFALSSLLSNFRHSRQLLSCLHLLLWTPYVDFLLHLSFFISICFLYRGSYTPQSLSEMIALLGLLTISLLFLSITSKLDQLLGLKTSTDGVQGNLVLFIQSRVIYVLSLIALLFLIKHKSQLNELYLMDFFGLVVFSQFMVITVSLVYVTLWSPLSYFLVIKIGKAPKSVWPVLPIYYIYQSLRAVEFRIFFEIIPIIVSHIRNLLTWEQFMFVLSRTLFRKNNLILIPMTVVIIFLPVITTSVLIPFFSFIGKLMGAYLKPVMILAGSIVTLFIVSPFIVDAITLYRWERTKRKALSASVLRELASKYYSGIFCLRFLRSVRSNNAVITTDRAARVLSKFGRELQRAYDVGDLKAWGLKFRDDNLFPNGQVKKINLSLTKLFFLMYITLWSPRFGHNFDIIDEIYKIREQIELMD